MAAAEAWVVSMVAAKEWILSMTAAEEIAPSTIAEEEQYHILCNPVFLVVEHYPSMMCHFVSLLVGYFQTKYLLPPALMKLFHAKARPPA